MYYICNTKIPKELISHFKLTIMYYLAFPTKNQAEGKALNSTRQSKSANAADSVEQRSEYWTC